MTEVRPALAIRIPRPWTTEEDFLANESETISRTGILLLGTHSRPPGTILRFEVTLQTGAPMVRGEGRVVSYNEDAFAGQPGLLLKFTRLDPKSKAFVDRVAAQRQGPPSISTSSVAVAALAPLSVRGYPLSQPPQPPSHPADDADSTKISSANFRVNALASSSPSSSFPASPASPAAPAQAYRPSTPPPVSSSPSTIPPARASVPPPLPPAARRSVPPPLPAAARLSNRPSAPPPTEVTSAAGSTGATPSTPSTPSIPPPSIPPLAAQKAPSFAPAKVRSNPPPTLAAMAASAVMSAGTPVPPLVSVREASYSRTRAIQAPPNREDLLTRLRARAQSLPEETRTKILAKPLAQS